jgi:hypothetical protein
MAICLGDANPGFRMAKKRRLSGAFFCPVEPAQLDVFFDSVDAMVFVADPT